jgi:hypothetical protein
MSLLQIKRIVLVATACILIPGCDILDHKVFDWPEEKARTAQASEHPDPAATTTNPPKPPVVTPTPTPSPAMATPPTTTTPPVTATASGCRLQGWVQPRNLQVIAIGIRAEDKRTQGEPLQALLEISQSQPLALILSSPQATRWKVEAMPGTTIAAIYLTGSGRQQVEATGVPAFNTTEPTLAKCGYGYIAVDNLSVSNPISEHLFGKRIDQIAFYNPATRRVDSIGQSAQPIAAQPVAPGHSAPTPAPRTASPDALPDGKSGLDEAVRRGYLREARPDDIDAFMRTMQSATAYNSQQPNRPDHLFAVYVVQREFTLPPGLFGAHAASFIVPKGLPRPHGELGHSTLYDWNTMTCAGVDCWGSR